MSQPQNPFRSRSTVIVVASLTALLVIVLAVLKSGFWDGSFGGMCILLLREVVAAAFGHQLKSDQMKSSNPTSLNPS